MNRKVESARIEVNELHRLLRKNFCDLTAKEKVALKWEYLRRKHGDHGKGKPRMFLATNNGELR